MAHISSKDFSEQVRIFSNELSKAFEYVDIEEVYEAKTRMYEANALLDADIPTFVAYVSYIGSLFRISYYKYVYKQGFDVRALADAGVLTLMFTGTYRFEFEPYMKQKDVKIAVQNSRYPEWTKIGLLGGCTSDIVKYGEVFSKYMDELVEKEAK